MPTEIWLVKEPSGECDYVDHAAIVQCFTCSQSYDVTIITAEKLWEMIEVLDSSYAHTGRITAEKIQKYLEDLK